MSKCLRRVRKMFGVLEEVDVLRLRCVLACLFTWNQRGKHFRNKVFALEVASLTTEEADTSARDLRFVALHFFCFSF